MRAKFKLVQKTISEGGCRLKFEPVTTGSYENEQFFKWTPYGSIDIGTINQAVEEKFSKIGAEYYVDFTPAN
jgi:hypothetical protein